MAYGQVPASLHNSDDFFNNMVFEERDVLGEDIESEFNVSERQDSFTWTLKIKGEVAYKMQKRVLPNFGPDQKSQFFMALEIHKKLHQEMQEKLASNAKTTYRYKIIPGLGIVGGFAFKHWFKEINLNDTLKTKLEDLGIDTKVTKDFELVRINDRDKYSIEVKNYEYTEVSKDKESTHVTAE